jgi:hypothetical protein
VVTHLNLAYDHFDRIEQAVLAAVLDAPPHRAPQAPLDAAIRQSAPGVYEATAGKLTNVRIAGRTGRIQITDADGGLVLRSRRGEWKQGVRMRPLDPSDPRYFELETDELDPARLVVTTDEGGRVTGLHLDRLVHLVRNDSLEPWA